MSEPKYVYRLPPCHSFDIAAMETWLEDMAARGLILAKDSFFCGVATFEKGQPRRIKYRLEATDTPGGTFSSTYDPEDGLIQLYHQMGWQYRGRRGQFFIFASEDPDAPELNTDPLVQAHTIHALAKYQRSQLFSSIFNLLFICWLNLSSTFFSGILVMGTPAAVLLIGLFTYTFVRQIITVMQLEKLKKQLRAGHPLEHRSDYVNRKTPYFAGKVTRFILWILALSLFAYNMTAGKTTVPLSEYEGDYPFATLQELYPDAEVTLWDSYRESEVTIWSDFLAPVCCEYSESSNVRFDDTPSDIRWLDVLYFDTRWEWSARVIAKELTYQTGASPLRHFIDELFGEEPIILTQLDLPGADFAGYFYKDRGYPHVVIQKGCTVIKANLNLFDETVPFTPETFAQAMLDSLD